MIPQVGHHQHAEPLEPPDKLRKAAEEFEAILLADLLKLSDSGSSSGDSEHGYDDMRIQALASGLASRGGVGIARMLLQKLTAGTVTT